MNTRFNVKKKNKPMKALEENITGSHGMEKAFSLYYKIQKKRKQFIKRQDKPKPTNQIITIPISKVKSQNTKWE